MVVSKVQQIEFSSVLFDTLFSLVIFFSLDSFMDINNPLHFVFYLFSLIIVIHWWLIFKAADDAFDKEVTDSGLDLVIGIIELIIIEYIVLTARSYEFIASGWYVVALLLVDLLWTIVWLYVGKWRTKNTQKIKEMEIELKNNLKTIAVGLATFILLMLSAQFVSPITFIVGFVIFYFVFILLSFRHKIIDIKMF